MIPCETAIYKGVSIWEPKDLSVLEVSLKSLFERMSTSQRDGAETIDGTTFSTDSFELIYTVLTFTRVLGLAVVPRTPISCPFWLCPFLIIDQLSIKLL